MGRAIAQRLAADGAHLVLLDIRDLSETQDLIEDDGASAERVEVDVTDERGMHRALEAVETHTLVNNAGYYAAIAGDNKKPFQEIPADEWDRVMAVNVKGLFFACKAALPNFEPGGNIVNISSDTVLLGVPGFLHYVASKAAVIGLTRAMASELGELNIHVNAITPGFTETPATADVPDDYWDELVSRQTIKSRVQPEDIANTVAFLASSDSDMITGQILNVDGGLVYY